MNKFKSFVSKYHNAILIHTSLLILLIIFCVVNKSIEANGSLTKNTYLSYKDYNIVFAINNSKVIKFHDDTNNVDCYAAMQSVNGNIPSISGLSCLSTK